MRSALWRPLTIAWLAAWAATALPARADAAYTALYGSDGNDFYQFTGACSVANLKSDCWNGLIMFALTVQPNGDLTIASGSVTLASNGVYLGDPNWGPNVSALKAPPTSVTRYELCVGGWGDSSFANIQALVAAQGSGPGSILYRNFQALKNACPGLDAINDDDEGNYDLGSTTAFGWMLNSLGMRLTQAPYMNQPFWVALKNNLGGVCDIVYLQCYQGGAGNSPAQWDAAYGNGFHVTPGEETNYASQAQFATWAATAGSTGGFFWPDWYWSPGTSWSSLIENGIGANCGAAPPVIPYLNVNGAGWQPSSSATVPYAAQVDLGPQSSQGWWNWTGPNGFGASTREIDAIPLSVGVNTFVATNTTSCVCQAPLTFTITMQGPPACGAGGGFGNAAAGSGGYDLAGQLDCARFSLAQAMTVDSLQVYMGAGTAGSGGAGIYTDNAGSPGSLLVQSDAYPVAPGWNSFVLPPTDLAAGSYWLAGSFKGTAVFDYSAGSGAMDFEAYAYNGSLPATVGPCTGYGWLMCINASGCLLPTPSFTVSPSPSPSPTRTPSATATPTRSASPSVSPSPTPSATATASLSPSLTSTATPSASSTVTTSTTPSATPTVSSTATPSVSLTASTTATPSASVTDSATSTPSLSPSALPTATPSLMPTASATASPTPSLTSTLTASALPSPLASMTAWASPSPSLTRTLASGQGVLAIDDGGAVPDPNPACVALHLQGDADAVTLRCYTKAMTLAWQGRCGPLSRGWNRVSLPTADLSLLSNGLYYLSVTAWRGDVRSRSLLLKFVRVR